MVLNEVFFFFKEFHFKRRHELMQRILFNTSLHSTTFYSILGGFHIVLVLSEIAKQKRCFSHAQSRLALNGATQGEMGRQVRQIKIKSSIMWLQLLFFDFFYIYKKFVWGYIFTSANFTSFNAA